MCLSLPKYRNNASVDQLVHQFKSCSDYSELSNRLDIAINDDGSVFDLKSRVCYPCFMNWARGVCTNDE